MASSLSFFIFLTLTVLQPLFSAANLHKSTSLFRSNPIPETAAAAAAPTPTTYFEVTKPIPLPKTKPCSYLILQHEFAYTYTKPQFSSTTNPLQIAHFTTISQKSFSNGLRLQKGRQFDRIFGVWVGGVEILRSCTAEPRRNGIVWTVKKDITRYYSLLMKKQSLAVYMGNVVNSKYTGVYHVNLTFHFYPPEENYSHNEVNSGDGFGSRADLILPISRNLPLNDGLWFEIENSTDVVKKEFKIPQNAYRAVLEVYVSFHEIDEFWYGNYPNDYISVNNVSYPGNGPFREVIVKLDDLLVGAIWPFTVIYTGGLNPFLWRPISGIGSFDLPTYNIEITPFLGKLLDGGKNHTFSFSVTNALNVWYIDANLHLWLDEKCERTKGELLKHKSSPLSMSLVSNFTGFNGLFTTNVSRSIVSSGWVKSSHGLITTKSRQEFKYGNAMTLGNHANLQILDQTIKFKGSVGFKTHSSSIWSTKLFKKFRVYVYSDTVDKGNGSQVALANVTLSFDEKSRKSSDFGSSVRRLSNWQHGDGYMLLKNADLVDGLGSTRQDYRYSGGELCYSRNVRSSNYTILYDNEGKNCKHSEMWGLNGEKEEMI
ncbi:hypothetical protein DH2020_033704 [Rehmannia glutinosa]|uniref:Peptide N-acetyl-beta-D-glucosaminyl asparaginase amidase A N-terminal domain-containing protein n=1 Tax=Rehmannia glutinosa TaxID=99300 RepID=A0ABR0VBP3_REHGL